MYLLQIEAILNSSMEIKIVSYNVNGLRPRIAQFGSLLKFLSSLDADIICLQETKLSRQEITADLVMAEGYESFVSCTRTTGQGRVCYSGVATFCRVKSPFSSKEVALPCAAEEGFTGLLENSRGFGSKINERPSIVDGLEGFEKEELLKVDSEGRCIVTDHDHFGGLCFSIFMDLEFQTTIQKEPSSSFHFLRYYRWEFLINQGRTVVVVGDLNIAPAAIDRCDAKPDFEKNEFRTWLRSMLVERGGPFYDTFRAKHPERREAYTCWSQSTGAEEFNYGSRIDHILISKTCLHKEHGTEENNFVTCHVKDCDILMEFQRWKPGITPRWKGGRSIKLEGSDHVPIFTTLIGIPDVQEHSTPSLSSRYAPMVRGIQQTIASVFMKRQEHRKAMSDEDSISWLDVNDATLSCSDKVKQTFQSSSSPEIKGSKREAPAKKKPKQNQWSQLSLKSFFQKNTNGNICDEKETQIELNIATSNYNHDDRTDCGPSQKENNNFALLEWQRIQERMQNSIPLCKGHGETCVSRVVKKAGPNCGRGFYACSRPEGPASNPESNCGYFKWVASKSRYK